MTEVLRLHLGDERYEEVLGQLRDEHLAGEMWADAEHRLEEAPGKTWVVVLVDGLVAAWCAARAEGQLLVCSDNYERRGPGRRDGLYRLAYRARHEALVAGWPGPAVTYLFPGRVVTLHEADGWRRTGLSGVGEVEGHTWVELRREP